MRLRVRSQGGQEEAKKHSRAVGGKTEGVKKGCYPADLILWPGGQSASLKAQRAAKLLLLVHMSLPY